MISDVLGNGLQRVDAIRKVSGDVEYTLDRRMPGMLYGKILRSPYPHALIKSIDTSKAEQIEGVRVVITAIDVPMNKFSFLQDLADKTILCAEKVRYVGDEVAAVAADSIDIASAALDSIDVIYEEIPAVLDVDEAMKPGAPRVHDGESNICFRTNEITGDPDRAFKECSFIYDDIYVTHNVSHCCMEVSNCIAKWSTSGRLTVWVNAQAPHLQRQEIARVLGIPLSDVQIIGSAIGGGFGSKLVMDMKVPIAAILSKKTGKAVKIENTRSEEFATGRSRYAYTIYLKTGVKQDGTLWARQMRIVADNGAYHEKGPGTLALAKTIFSVMYNVPHSKFEGILVYTNKQPSGAFRGFGNPQITFAMETQLDALAEKMGTDPFELRVKNVNVPGQKTYYGERITSCGQIECMRAAASAAKWSEKVSKSRGIGIANVMHLAAGWRLYAYNATETFIKISEEGKVSIVTPAPEIGQGAHTAIAQIVGEELGVGLENIRIIADDTDLTPYDLGAWGSRTTFICGNAALSAAKDVKRQLFDIAGEVFNADPKNIVIEKGKFSVSGFPDKGVRLFSELVEYAFKKKGQPVSGRGKFVDKRPDGFTLEEESKMNIPAFTFGTQIAEIKINKETGAVKVLSITAAHDVGKTINATMAEGQIEGGVVQGIGYALMEKLIFDRGKVVNDGFTDYKTPRFTDIPYINSILIESGDPYGPFGAKGIGESSIVPTAAAIANAIFNACGVRIRKLPILPEDILNGLAEIESKR